MDKQYDLVILGTGTAAMVAATRINAAGWSVAVIDFRPFGGTCALRGCDPKKMLIGGGEAIDHVRRMSGKGVDGDAHIDWPKLMAFKHGFTDPVPAKNEKMYRDQGIEMYHGKARFTGRDTLEVNGESLRAKHFLIATGAEPVTLGIKGEEHLITNEEFLVLKEMPARIVLVGGGYIAAEFSHIAARAGSHVVVLQHGPHMLTGFDPDLVGWLMRKFEDLGITVHVDTKVESIEQGGDGYVVHTSSAHGPASFEADLVVHAAGRVPALPGLNLEAAGITLERGRLKLNEYLQSLSNPAVYAAGDAAQAGPPLTPVSSLDAKVVVANLLKGNHLKPDYRGVPSVAFTVPPIAMIGMSEEEAKKKGLKFRKKSENASTWFTARQAAEKVYGFKVLVDEASDQILGAHLVGPHVDEVINIFAMAIRHNLTAADLKSTVFAYPTGASDIGDML